MKYVDEYREPSAVLRLADAVRRTVTRSHTIMEVCGGQTHTIVRYGLDGLVPASVNLVHGPGCPVCVTSLETIDRALAIAARPGTIFCSFGDVLRVPGSRGDLQQARSQGADVRVVYSPLDAVKLAAIHSDRRVVFFAIGFETTAPACAMAAWIARREHLTNFSLLVSHVLVPPMMRALLDAPDNRVQAFLGPGHVCTVMGHAEYEPIARRFGVPVIITGFDPVDILEGILRALRQLEAGVAEVENQYGRAVRREGNPHARRLMDEVFEICDRTWRGVGMIPKSGLRLRDAYRDLDAERLFEVEDIAGEEDPTCISGQVLKGLKKPTECAAFGTRCTPETPLGATMVSAEGACAAYMACGRRRDPQPTLSLAQRRSP